MSAALGFGLAWVLTALFAWALVRAGRDREAFSAAARLPKVRVIPFDAWDVRAVEVQAWADALIYGGSARRGPLPALRTVATRALSDAQWLTRCQASANLARN